MRKLHTRKGGFTLIELMIVVAIIGILAAIAIPNFLRFQLKAKSSEGKTNIAAIRTAEESYYSEFGNYVSADLSPPQNALSAKTDYSASTGFGTVGWSPEGQVFFTYAVGSDALGTGFGATAAADIDADLTEQVWGYKKPVSGGGDPPVKAHNVGTCAIATLPTAQVAPCDSTFGQSVF